MGKAALDGSIYQPIRHLAGRTAATAPPKDYYKQIEAIYNGITRHWWRYTYDPQGTEVLILDGPRMFDLTLGRGQGDPKGYGDCDEIAGASAALLRSIGMDTRLVTTAPPNSPYIFNHIFVQTKPPKSKQWVTFDPVVYPKHGLGFTVPHDRIAYWDLNGRFLGKLGKFPARFDQEMALYGLAGPVLPLKTNYPARMVTKPCHTSTHRNRYFPISKIIANGPI